MHRFQSRSSDYSKSSRLLCAAVASTLALSGSTYGAITMETDVDGMPFTLIHGVGHGGQSGNNIAVTSDGYVVTNDTASGGYEVHILSKDLKRRANATGVDSQYALTQGWQTGQDLYAGSVAGGTTLGTLYNVVGAGITRATPNNTHFGWNQSSTPQVGQYQWQASGGGYGIQQASRASASGGATTKIAPLALTHYTAAASYNSGSGQWRGDLDYVATVSGKFQMVGGFATSGAGNTFDHSPGLVKMEWAETSAPSGGPPPNAAGALSVTGGATSSTVRYLVDSTVAGTSQQKSAGLLNNLVPGEADVVNGLAYHPTDGTMYFVSTSGGANDFFSNDSNATNDYIWSDSKIFLSAVSFSFGDLTADSQVTYLDLDPNSANRHLEITWVQPSGVVNGSATGAGNSLVHGADLAFSPTGDKLYVSNVQGERIFIFNTAPVPEPASLGLFGLGAVALLRRRR